MSESSLSVSRNDLGHGSWRDALLILLGVLSCIAIVGLTWTYVASRQGPHRTLQTMIANERLIRMSTYCTEELQRERFMATLSTAGAKEADRPEVWEEQIGRTDQSIKEFEQALSKAAIRRDEIDATLMMLERIPQIRKAAQSSSADQWPAVCSAYSQLIDAVIESCQATRDTETGRGMGKFFVKMVLIQTSREAASRLQVVLDAHCVLKQPFSAKDVLEVARLWTTTSEFLGAAMAGVGAKSNPLLVEVYRSAPWRTLRETSTRIVEHGPGATVDGLPDPSKGQPSVAASILAVERLEGNVLHAQITQFDQWDQKQSVGMYAWVATVFVCQVIVAVLSLGSVIMRRRLESTNVLLSERETDLDTTLRSLGDAVIATDTDACVTQMNPAAEKLTGWSLAEASGQSLETVFHPIHAKTREPIANPLYKALQEGEVVQLVYDTILLSRDGTEHHIASNASPIVNSEQRIRGAVLVVRDITAEHKMRQELRDSEVLHRTLMENLPAGVVIIDPATRVIESINPYAAMLFGAAEEQIVGRQCHSFLCPSQKNACPICDLDQTVDNAERIMLRANGTRVPILKSVKRVQVKGRERLLECFVNISANKEIEANLRSAKQALEQHVVALRFANQALEESSRAVETGAKASNEILANMSHEILTIMTAILGFAERLLTEPGLEKAPQHRVEAFKTIARNGRRLLTVIDNILDLSKLEAGKMQLEQATCSPVLMLMEVISITQVQADAKGLTLKLEYDGPVPECVCTDPKRFRQIMVHLVQNSIQRTESGEIRIVVSVENRKSARPKLVCKVIDSGKGLTSEEIKWVFEPFHKANATADRKRITTDLGLAISKRLAQLLEGVLIVDSRPGKGTTLTVSIGTGPLDKVSMIEDPSQISIRKTLRKTMASDAPTELNCRVLLAEDTPDIQRLIAAQLEDCGAEVSVVDNGQLAVEQAWAAQHDGCPYDVILMDMQMPVMDGFEATERLRLEGYTGQIIALTVRSMRWHRSECLKSGCNHFLSKPIDPKRLISLVAESLAAAGSSKRSPTCQGILESNPSDADGDRSSIDEELV